MPTPVDLYVSTALVHGVIYRAGSLRDVLEGSSRLTIEQATSQPLDGAPARLGQPLEVLTEDVLAAAALGDGAPAPIAVHMTWHSLRLEVGPYLVEGELPTQPGFDPGRALTRPAGNFVVLRDARITLIGRPRAGEARHGQVLVQRYAVECVAAELNLGFFFPAARVVEPAGHQIGG